MDLAIIVELAEECPGFRTGYPYAVYSVHADRFLLVNDLGRFTWVAAEKLCPVSITRGDTKLFDRDEFLQKRRYEQYVGQQVLLHTWEDLGLPLDHRTDEGMLVFRVAVDGFDGKLLMLRGGEGFVERSGVLADQIYQVDVIDDLEDRPPEQ